MTLRLRHLLAVLAVLVAAGCGSDDEPKGEELPRATVAQLERRLNEIDRRYNDARDNDNPGACDDIERDSFPAIETLLASLPDDVDPDVRKATEDSFARLRDLTSNGCSDVEPAQTETVPPETDVETIPPETVPPQTQTTPPETDTVPPDEGDEDGATNGDGGASPDQGGGGLQAPPAGGEE